MKDMEVSLGASMSHDRVNESDVSMLLTTAVVRQILA